ncbi:imelysin family protein [Psychrobacter aestuarii]|uniref:Imelysin family protein n=1 Tax=Psychrobacter aestuarii TaxID=556327 RepID=A0ABN0VU81_9GAMM|nr:imelysin family protein [Psychrobacter aestuarii]
MKKNHALMMALSALSAGFLISCAKPAEKPEKNADAQADSQNVDTKTDTSAATADSQPTIQAADISPEAEAAYLKHVANDLVIPAYADAAKQSEALNTLAQKHCQSAPVSGEALEALRAQWLVLAQAWANAEMIHFGPATESMNNLYINYYPDERGLVHSGVADLISANPSLTADALANESAIVQGVPGLEEVLYSNDSLDAGQCAYVMSASQALQTRLQSITDNWQQNASKLLAIDETKDNDMGLNQWMNSLLSLVETMKSSAIEQPLGLNGKSKGHVPAATAGESRAIINAKVAALNTALTDPVLTAMLSSNNSQIGNDLSTALAETSSLLAQMPEDITQADKAQQTELHEHLTRVTQLIKRQLIPALGIRVGFNSTDGD